MSEYDEFVARALGKAPQTRGHKLRAPYNFVPVEEKVLPSPNDCISHARPHPEGISGLLSISFTNETPLLVGADEEDNNQNLFDPADPGKSVLVPGASLRGMIRAVTEIISLGRLNFVDDFVGALRDMSKYRNSLLGDTRRNPIRAGWLFKVSKDGRDQFYLLDAGVPKRIAISSQGTTGLDDLLGFNSAEEWHEMPYADRLALIRSKNLFGLQDCGLFGVPGEGQAQIFFTDETADEARKPGQTQKTREYIALYDPDARANLVSTGAYFVQSVKDSNKARYEAMERQAPNFGQGTLAEQRAAMDRSAWPVFWYGTETAPILSLSAFIKMPHAHSLLDVARRTQPARGRALAGSGDPIDLCEGLFGWVPQDIDDTAELHQRGPREKAYRARVKFGFARADFHGDMKVSLPGISPRPSFAPFYLRAGEGASHPIDYSNPKAMLAGRKRYPARNMIADSPPSTGGDQTVECKFLETGHHFTSTIKLHNLCPEELGALLWALTLGQGDQDRGYRHMLGRGKPFGYGQIRLKIEGMTLRQNQGTDDASRIAASALSAFRAWIEGAIGQPLEQCEPVKRLLNMSHAPTGEALQQQQALTYPSTKDDQTDSEATLNSYVGIRGQSHDLHRERAATAPGDEGIFLGLPPYPRKPE